MNFYDELKYKVLGGDPLNSCVIRGRRKDVHRPIDPGTFLGWPWATSPRLSVHQKFTKCKFNFCWIIAVGFNIFIGLPKSKHWSVWNDLTMKNFLKHLKILNFLNFRFLIFLIFNFTLFVIIKILIYNNDILPALWDIK